MKLDKYYSPLWVLRVGVELVDLYCETPSSYTDPCAGDGRLANAVPGDRIHGLFDIEPDNYRVSEVDARTYDWSTCRADAIVTNPPYAADTGSAADILRPIVKDFEGPVAALVRLPWLEACRDREWAWLGGPEGRPLYAFEIGRISYEYPDGESAGRSPRFSSVWVIWDENQNNDFTQYRPIRDDWMVDVLGVPPDKLRNQ